MSRRLVVQRLGRIGYAEGVERQKALVQARVAGEIDDTLMFVEHPPVITLGVRTRGATTNVRADAGALAAQGVEVHETGRGGDVTFHGPGQLVGYPIIDLKPDRQDVHRYVRDLEDAVIRTLAAHAIEGERIDGLTGVWLSAPPRKICSIGVHVSRWVTTHGYALNVDLDPAPFTDWITACGLEDAAFTTMARELDRPLAVDDVRPAAVEALADVFDLELEELPAEDGAGLWAQPIHEKIAG